MASPKLVELRKKMRESLKSDWMELFDAKDELKGIAVSTGYAKALKDCAEGKLGGAPSVKACYANNASKIAEEYKKLWGTAS